MKLRFIILFLVFGSSPLLCIMNPPKQVFMQRRVLSVRFENCFIPITAFQMRRCFQQISRLSSNYSDNDDVIMVHNIKKQNINSAYSLPDTNIYIRSWPKLREATIKIVYDKDIPGLDLLALLADLFAPERFDCLKIIQ